MFKTIVVAAVAVIAAALAVAGLSTAAAASTGDELLCVDNQHLLVHNAKGKPFFIRNPYWRGVGEACIRHDGGATWHVTRTPTSGHGSVVAFPDIMTGCIWEICTPGTKMPMRVSKVKRMYSTWRTGCLRGRPCRSGFWNAAYDLWIGRHAWTRSGMATRDGAELMVWPNYHGFQTRMHRKFKIDGRWWYFTHWPHCATHPDICWRLLQFRAVHPRPNVTGLNLRKFLMKAVHLGLVKKRWFIESVGAGFEVWGGGGGLVTSKFNLSVQKRWSR